MGAEMAVKLERAKEKKLDVAMGWMWGLMSANWKEEVLV
jgi:hypothetical protein